MPERGDVVVKRGATTAEQPKWRETAYGRFSVGFSEDSLANLCDEKNGVQTGPFGSQLHQRDYVPLGTPIITVEHLSDNRILHQDLPCVSDQDRERLSKYALRPGDIVFSRVGSVDRRALVREAEEGWLFSGRCLRVRPDQKKIDPTYLSYFFGLPTFREHMKAIAVGATMPSLNTRILGDVDILYPPLPEQRAIAHVLGALDDKIELNRGMNQTLEEMARALFKSWFVDFDPVRAKMALSGQSPTEPQPHPLRHSAPLHHSPIDDRPQPHTGPPHHSPIEGQSEHHTDLLHHSPIEGQSERHTDLLHHSPLEGESAGRGRQPPASRWGEIQRSYSRQTLSRARALRQRHSDPSHHSPIEGQSEHHTDLLHHSPLEGESAGRGRQPPASRWGEIQRSYSRQTLSRARALRQRQTDAEGLLWHYLRKKQLGGYKFRRQQPIGPYVADFACMSEKLLVELDGGQHARRKAHDERRDEFLRARGFRLLRFWNNEVFENCFGVLEKVWQSLRSPPPRQPEPGGSTAATPPPGGSDGAAQERDDPAPSRSVTPSTLKGEGRGGGEAVHARSPTDNATNAWTVERARAYLNDLPPEIADLFPNRLVPSELGEIPEGWEVKTLGELVELAYGKALKAANRKGGQVPVYGSNGQVGWHDERLVAGPGIVVGRKGNPGIVTWSHSDFFPIDTTFYVVPKAIHGDLPFLFFALTSQDLPSVSADSAVPGLNRNLAYMNNQLVPDKHVLAEFNDYARANFSRQHRLEEESRRLAAQRDALLPKLVSGEVRVGDLRST